MSNSDFLNLVRSGAIIAAVAIVVAARADAHGGGGDINIFTHATLLKVDVGFAVLDDDDISQVERDDDVSVFQAVLIPRTPTVFPPDPYTIGSQEPGFDSEEELPPLANVRANTLNLWYWDGTDAVSFAPAAGIGVTGGYATTGELTDTDGGFHDHPTFGLLGDTIPDGIYLAQVTISVAGLDDSAPYYLVTLKDESLYTGDPLQDAENGEQVGELVRAYLDDPVDADAPVFGGTDYTYYADAVAFARTLPVPEPSSIALVCLAPVCAVCAHRTYRLR